mmetsp:Transcript_29047/g.66079  ORF Transcript_29047/g.66079 Transcript_29047/m.66079 type:complete len:264 (-) Transcript_29047:7-798(-)
MYDPEAGDGSVAEAICLKVLVLGDASVGKTTLVSMLAGTECISNGVVRDLSGLKDGMAQWTVGCSISVLAARVDGKDVMVELWDVGGSRHYAHIRSTFYDGIDGVLLVYDVANLKSYHSLSGWLFELCCRSDPPSSLYWSDKGGVDVEGGLGTSPGGLVLAGRCPALVVANKCDLSSPLPRKEPVPPSAPPLLDRLLSGEAVEPWMQLLHDCPEGPQVMKRVCEVIGEAPQMQANGRSAYLENSVWRRFLKQAVDFHQCRAWP